MDYRERAELGCCPVRSIPTSLKKEGFVAIYELQTDQIMKIAETSFSDERVRERADLQRLLTGRGLTSQFK